MLPHFAHWDDLPTWWDFASALRLGVSQPDNQALLESLTQNRDSRLFSFPSRAEHNGWIVPDAWTVEKASLSHGSHLLFDGRKHPLAVAGYSCSYQGTLKQHEAQHHIFTRPELPNAYPFHCAYNYRPWVRDWGFCVPHREWERWGNTDLNVDLKTTYSEGQMLVADIHHAGLSDDTFVFNAHTCHPAQFNDGFAGIVVILQLMDWLEQQNTEWSYRAVFGPEHLGTVFYLAKLPESEIKNMRAGLFLEMVGINNKFALQRSFYGDSSIDQGLAHLLRHKTNQFRDGPFRSILGNDETVWEGPGIEVPFSSLSRCYNSPFYYSQYHTSEDNLAINDVGLLEETLELLKGLVNILENNVKPRRRFHGLPCLSNPKYDLYVERPDPTWSKEISEIQLKLGAAQDTLLRKFNGDHSILSLAEDYDLPFSSMKSYLDRFYEKDLIDWNSD